MISRSQQMLIFWDGGSSKIALGLVLVSIIMGPTVCTQSKNCRAHLFKGKIVVELILDAHKPTLHCVV